MVDVVAGVVLLMVRIFYQCVAGVTGVVGVNINVVGVCGGVSVTVVVVVGAVCVSWL